MHIYMKIYEFGASAGAFEGYVYRKQDLDREAVSYWVENLVTAYRHLPAEVREPFQPSLDQTIGRAIRSLTPVLGEESDIIRKLALMVVGPMPESADNFQKMKWFNQ